MQSETSQTLSGVCGGQRSVSISPGLASECCVHGTPGAPFIYTWCLQVGTGVIQTLAIQNLTPSHSAVH